MSSEEGPEDLSLVAGGPLYRIWRRTHLLKPPLDLLIPRAVVITLLTWLPLLPLTFLSGHAFKGVHVPFLFDLDAHARFLIALPLLIIAELAAHLRIPLIVRQFLNRGLVDPEQRAKFCEIVASTLRFRDSVLPELLMLVLVWTLGHWVWERQTSLTVATWYASREGDEIRYTLAGYWLAFVSIPIFQFFILRWIYRFLLWYRFLWKVSRLDLKLIATHPDRAGGLGFLATSTYAFIRVLMSQTILFACIMGNRIWHASASVLDFKMEIAALLVLLLGSVFAPLTVFSWKLMAAKRVGVAELGNLAEKYVRNFDSKWIRGQAPSGEKLVGSQDIQSLADLANSYEVAQTMRPVPFGRSTVLQMGGLLILPFLPLSLTIIPVDKILDKLVRILL